MKNKLLILIALLVFGSHANAEQKALIDIKAPTDLDNIHVVKLNSDRNSTDFVIFIRKQVPLHKHVKHSETLYVLEGSGQMQLGDETIRVHPGDYIKVPEGVVHGVIVDSENPLKVLSVQAPEFFGKDRVKVD